MHLLLLIKKKKSILLSNFQGGLGGWGLCGRGWVSHVDSMLLKTFPILGDGYYWGIACEANVLGRSSGEEYKMAWKASKSEKFLAKSF